MTITIELSRQVARHCRSITRQRARNFYYGLKLLPEPRRTALYVMYTWMRKADDLVDNDDMSSQQKGETLSQFRTKTDAAIAGNPPSDDPMWQGLAFVASRFNLNAELLHAMLDGQLNDIHDQIFDTFEALEQYCYQVASTVGLVCIEIWGYSQPQARELAISRGIAFQLTNILRDLREDFDNGRIYLPQSDFTDHNIMPRDLREWSQPERCGAFMAMQIHRAESFYERSIALDTMITPDCRPTLWAMTRIYRSLLEKIKTDPAQVIAPQRVRLSALQKAKIAVQAKWLLPSPEPAGAVVP